MWSSNGGRVASGTRGLSPARGAEPLQPAAGGGAPKPKLCDRRREGPSGSSRSAARRRHGPGGPRHSRRNCCARPIARLLVLLLTCAPHGAGTGETPRTLQIETRKRRSTAPGLPPLPAEPQLPRGQAGLRKKAKVMAKGCFFFFFFFSFYLKKHELQAQLPARRVRGSCRLPGRHAAGSCHHCPGSESLLIQPGTVLLLRVTEMHDGHTHGRTAS